MAKKPLKYIQTVTQIENLKPRDERYEIPDATLRPLRIVVFPSGAKSWVYRYRFGGRTRKLTLECGATDLARARELGATAMNKVAAKTDPGIEKLEKKRAGNPLTVEGMITRYLDRHVYKRNSGKAVKRARQKVPLRSAAEIERVIRKELEPFKNRQAADGISSFEAKKLIDDVAERGAVMANRTLAYCKGLYSFAVAEKIAASSPFADLKLTEEDDRERVLSAEELKAVWNGAGKLGHPYTAIVRLLALTGQRLNEIACLRWSEIDLDRRQITFPGLRTKNGRPHIVALSDASVEILEAAKKMKVESEEGLVFTVTGGRLNGWSKMRSRLSEAVTKALDKSPEHWTLHDLRRTFATRAVEDLKIPPHVVDKILNHSNGVVRGVAAVYNRAELLDERRAALEKWDRHVSELVHGKTSNVVQLRA
jgi:integrase